MAAAQAFSPGEASGPWTRRPDGSAWIPQAYEACALELAAHWSDHHNEH